MDNYKLLFFRFPTACFAGLAQLVEQCPRKAKIAGSSPVSGIDPKKKITAISAWIGFNNSRSKKFVNFNSKSHDLAYHYQTTPK